MTWGRSVHNNAVPASNSAPTRYGLPMSKIKKRREMRKRPVVQPLEPRALLSTVYVDANAPGATQDGTSWATAYTGVQAALTAATPGTEIRVANGTYKPTSGTSRTLSFVLKNGVSLLGG